MIVTHAMRLFLGHQLGPFEFKKDIGYLPNYNVPNLGLYVHIPFCNDLCPFCPYYKIKLSPDYFKPYLKALIAEIALVAKKVVLPGKKRKATSLYFGGGSPALMIDELSTIRKIIDNYFIVEGNAGVELHPRDITIDTAMKLENAGFDMVSIGVQSFNGALLKNLGRDDLDFNSTFKHLNRGNFQAIDIDLIFGIPGQSENDLRTDFLKAVEAGATQISTYPFIDFSYADNRKKPQGRIAQKKLLSTLLKTADESGFVRTSVWTFGKKNAPKYSSITRDCFLGFGPSATSLGLDSFKANTFSVDAYIETANKHIVPTSLRMQFTTRTRKLYWLFWNCYKGYLSEKDYKELFSSELNKDFSFWLRLGKVAGLFNREEQGWALTELGSYKFHWVEQEYTHQYIDKTWKTAMDNPWPEKISLY
ncbi:MAG: hypothetical protein BA869_09775 [Desulfuromonadales bacterium C00003107]|jgi:oxygen-independent coproporphyrinogen-3 oxidase|nr:MAG: hypothetical protein BA869_09775 [Desulfuromonadales bacterium C00003107]